MTASLPKYRMIPLSRGLFAKVDADVFDELSKYSWRASGRAKYGFYAVRHTTTKANDNTDVRMHRQIMGCTPGDGVHVDHINRDTLDNRRSNLRRVDRFVNLQNTKLYSNSKTGVKGVNWHKGAKKYMANRSFNGTYYYCGLYNTVEEAAKVLEALERAHTS